jgi:hypothetical protein
MFSYRKREAAKLFCDFLKIQGGRNYNLGRRTQCCCFCYYYGDNRNSKKTKVDVKENHISLQERGNITIAELKAESIFGEILLTIYLPRSTRAIASSNQVVVMKITNEIIEKFNLPIQKYFQNQLIQILVERLDDMNKKIIKLKASTLKN